MDERRHVHELDRNARRVRRLMVSRRRQKDEQRPKPLAPGRERLCADRRREARMPPDRRQQALFDLVEVDIEPFGLVDLRQRVQAATPVWSATMPPAKNRYRTCSKPADSISSASSFASGNRRTLAGR